MDNNKTVLRAIVCCCRFGWIDLAQDGEQWRAFVNAVMSRRVPQNVGRSWVAAQLAASQEGFLSMELILSMASSALFSVILFTR
jgi:hypothetical protein